MGKFDDFVAAVLSGAEDIANQTLSGFGNQARADAKAFLDRTKADLQRWAILRAEKKLTDEDFSDLVEAKRALAEMHALTRAGIAAATLERFRSELIQMVIDKAMTLL